MSDGDVTTQAGSANNGMGGRDLGQMVAGLRNYLPEGRKISGLRVLSAGHSNETYYIEGLDRILRMPPAQGGLLPPYDMEKQYRVLDAVYRMSDAPPVPRVYELCTESEILGDPFFVMQALKGEEFEYTLPDWLSSAPSGQREWMSNQWVTVISGLHNNPPEQMPAEEIGIQAYAEKYLAMAIKSEGDRELIAILDNLVKDPPKASGAPTPVHGDPKHGNTLWTRDGKLLAFLDWEMSHIGEPLTDLGWMLCFYNQGHASAALHSTGWLQEPAILDLWQQKTGRTAVDIQRYKLLALAKVCAIMSRGVWLYNTGQLMDPRIPTWDMKSLLDTLIERSQNI